MRSRILLVSGLALCLAALAVGVAIAAKPTVIEVGKIVVKVNGEVTPRALPKNRLAPIALRASAQIGTTDGSQPPPLREVIIDFDKHGTVNARGLPICRAGQIIARKPEEAKKACKGSLVGTGTTKVRVAFVEQPAFITTGPLLLFNGGVKGGKTRMYVHAYVSVPAPTAIVTPVVIEKIKKGRFGTRATAKIPLIANGAGSVIYFKFKIDRKFRFKGKKRSYLVAQCANRRFYAHATSVFGDSERTRASGTIVRFCKQRG